MSYDNEYTVLHVAGIKRCKDKCGRCVIILKSATGEAQLTFIADEHDAARIALRAFPQPDSFPQISLWTDFAKHTLNTFGISASYMALERNDAGDVFAKVAFENPRTKEILHTPINIIDGILFATDSDIKIIISNSLLEELTGRHVESLERSLAGLPAEIIEEQMNEAVKKENYELASLLRDELKRRNV